MKKAAWLLLGVVVAAVPTWAYAHWCSNIYITYSRIVVKPERQSIDVAVGQTGELKVRVRNNFPYTLNWIKLRANNPPGLTVTVTPDGGEAEGKTIYPGQKVTFTLQITRTAAGSDDVSTLNLEVAVNVVNLDEGWRTLDNDLVDADPNPDDLRNLVNSGQTQAHGLTYARLAELGCPNCESEGVTNLIDLLQQLQSRDDFMEAWSQQFMRSGHALGVRLRFLTSTSPSRGEVVAALLDAASYNGEMIRGPAAFCAAYGGDDPGVSSRLQTMADTDPSERVKYMAKAALYILGNSQYRNDLLSCMSAGDQSYPAENDPQYNELTAPIRTGMVCAAALGIMGEDQPVETFLLPRAGDGTRSTTHHAPLFASYLVQLVVYSRRGGPDGTGIVSFLDEEVIPDDVAPSAPTNLVVAPGN